MKSKIQNPKFKILLVGAGPAGTSAAIRLAQKGWRVTLLEREKFPREKLCGEFISPECFAHFRALGVSDEILSAGGDSILETVFYAPNGKFIRVPSKWFNKAENAVGLSRAAMDFRLLETAKKAGVEVLEETSVVNLLFENGKLGGVKARGKFGETFEIVADFTIDATGRASVLCKLAEREKLRAASGELQKNKLENSKSTNSNRLVGFKAHFKNAEITRGRCEIYSFRGGYGGLNYVENDLSNHCFLIRAETVREFGGEAERILRQVVFQNQRAAAALENAEKVNDWLAVTVDEFGLKNLNPAPNLLAVGDAGAFIDPFTGSGMLMALESGELLAQAITENNSSDEIATRYKSLHRAKFQRRLLICSLLRRAAFAPKLATFLIAALSCGNLPRKLLARATRPKLSAVED